MKKMKAAILILDVVLGLLLFTLCAGRRAAEWRETAGRVEREGIVGATALLDGAAESATVVGGMALDGAASSKEFFATDEKKIALTFDDGPHPIYTEQLLDGLKERGVCATFFVTGEHAELHPDLIRRMREEGHLVGNHTYSHIQLKKSNREEFKKELIKTNEIIQEITGEEVQYVRPPYGSWDKSFEKELNMFPVLWTVDPLDWCSRDSACVTRRVLAKAGENDIILLHDYYETSVTAAFQIVDELLGQGYSFVTVEEILFD